LWYSISNVLNPGSLEEAISQYRTDGGKFLAGGSYLVAEADPGVKDLIHIQPLLDRNLVETGGNLIVGAGLTLQELIRHTSADDTLRLAEAAKMSCFSKNIRNQRTLGGEVAWNRPDSEVNVYLRALSTSIEVISDEPKTIPISQVEKEPGIITSLRIDVHNIEDSIIKRFSLLPSAPAFLIIAAVRRTETITFSIGGKIDRRVDISFEKRPEDSELSDFAGRVGLRSDHFGSLAYKSDLLEQSLLESRNELWQ